MLSVKLTSLFILLDFSVDGCPVVDHYIENPCTSTSGAPHIYNSDFQAIMDERSL